MLNIFFVVRCFWEVKNVVWILGWVACLIAFISVFFPSWKTIFKQSRQLFNTSTTPGYLSSFSTSSYRNLNSFSTARWIDWDFFWILDSFSTASIHRDWLNSISTPFDQSKSSCMHCFSHVLHLSFILPSINILFHYIHAFLWILCAPLIIFIFLKWSVLASCTFVNHEKNGEKLWKYMVSF